MFVVADADKAAQSSAVAGGHMRCQEVCIADVPGAEACSPLVAIQVVESLAAFDPDWIFLFAVGALSESELWTSVDSGFGCQGTRPRCSRSASVSLHL